MITTGQHGVTWCCTTVHTICSFSQRLFGTLPKFVRGCDHVVKFFQCNKKSRKKAETRKSKGASDKAKRKEFETPHRIAEAVREQSLAGKENNKKTADATNTKEEAQNRVSEENPTKGNKQVSDEQSSVVDMDENRNDGKICVTVRSTLSKTFTSAPSCSRKTEEQFPDKSVCQQSQPAASKVCHSCRVTVS